MTPVNYRRRRVVALIALTIGLAGIAYAAMSGGSKQSAADRLGKLQFQSAGRQIAQIDLRPYQSPSPAAEARLRRAILNVLPTNREVRRGRATVTYVYARQRAVAEAMALRAAGGIVTVASNAVASNITAPVEKQLLRNNCEATALKILLATVNVKSSQLTLQKQMRTDGPLDPVSSETGPVWGDPNVGYVGRANGGGVAGGFGAYAPPIVDLARRYGVRLDSAAINSFDQIRKRLLSGRAVMVWVGLGNGPFKSWRTRSGKAIEVNLNEHTVVLTGMSRSGEISYVDPLEGARGSWTRSEFEPMWELLDRRAVST